ncbi:unnamed protein product [Ambrosiozyma monospora]|uniref:Unnamed protein product n=1 Tax=Ambrosiozyma monospora TaxID=43982 RepID=A0ACB5SUN7_AMBMO|nr:unnamed protein product [Ambrosiozyma monospora]
MSEFTSVQWDREEDDSNTNTQNNNTTSEHKPIEEEEVANDNASICSGDGKINDSKVSIHSDNNDKDDDQAKSVDLNEHHESSHENLSPVSRHDDSDKDESSSDLEEHHVPDAEDEDDNSSQSGLIKLPTEEEQAHDDTVTITHTDAKDIFTHQESSNHDIMDESNLLPAGVLESPKVTTNDVKSDDHDHETSFPAAGSRSVDNVRHNDDLITAQPAAISTGNTTVETRETQHEQVPEADYYIHTTVGSPLTEYDGQNPYTSYLVTVETDNPKLDQTSFQMRKRYSDFHFLYECLLNDYPTLVIPPLPNKQRLEYIKGGRFTGEFTAKRAISLNNFLQRVARHPTLKHSQVFHVFLENPDYWMTYKANLKINSTGFDAANSTSQNIESVTDFIMNSFKRPTVESSHQREFQDIQDKTAKLQENLSKIDNIYSKVIHKQQDLSDDFSKFGEEVAKLTILLKNDFDGKYKLDDETTDATTKEITSQFKGFSSNLKMLSERMYTLNHNIEYNYLTSLKDLEHYISQLKNLIKVKDAKALDYEMLCNYLEKTKQERDYLMGGGSVTSTAEGTFNFLTRKLESIAGLGAQSGGNLASERIQKLNNRIDMLEKEKETSKKVYDKYEADIVNEFQLFEKIKNDEITDSLKNLNGAYLDYYNNLIKDWKQLKVSTHEGMFNSKLSETDELFTSNDVLKNNDILNESLDKLKSNVAMANSATAEASNQPQ